MRQRRDADARTGARSAPRASALSRTEHMFFEGERIVAMREMILADDEKVGARACQALADAAAGLRRLLQDHDRPAGHDPAARSAAARVPAEDRRGDRGSPKDLGVGADKLRRAAELHEFNPMLGFRGIRLAVRYPEIAEMRRAPSSKARSRPAARPVRRHRRDHAAGHLRAPGVRSGQADHRLDGGGGRKETASMCDCGNHDRAAARGAESRRNRRERRILLLRHQRPDPDDTRDLARRRGVVPRIYTVKGLLPATVGRSTPKVSANWSRSPPSAGVRRGPASISASAASTAAILPRPPSARRRTRLCVVLAVPASRLPASRRRRRRSGGRRTRRREGGSSLERKGARGSTFSSSGLFEKGFVRTGWRDIAGDRLFEADATVAKSRRAETQRSLALASREPAARDRSTTLSQATRAADAPKSPLLVAEQRLAEDVTGIRPCPPSTPFIS